MRKGGTLIVIAIAILGLWTTSAFACHINANCYTATLVDNWHDDRITVRYADGYQTVLETHNLETQVANNGPHRHVVSAGFHNGNEWRYVSAPYGCVRPTTTTTTVAPTTTTTTEAPTSTSTTVPISTSTTTMIQTNTTSTVPDVLKTTTTVGSPPPTAVVPNPTTSTTRIEIGGPPVSAEQPPALRTGGPPELPHTGSNGLVPVAAVGAVCLLAGLAFVASKKKAQR